MPTDLHTVIAGIYRQEWARVVATTASFARDLDLAQECAQEAFAQALDRWPVTGLPDNPGAWLTTTARRKAIDAMRRRSVLERVVPQLVVDDPVAEGPVEDDRLRLIFTCCHPALAREAQVALTLRLVCGLSTAEVARAFLVSESAMAARITRAKHKIARARLPYRVPHPEQLAERTSAVLEVLHLIFTTGHKAPIGAQLQRRDLVESALGLGRTLRLLMPTSPDVAALLALMLLIDARAQARASADGAVVLLADQDRSLWDHAKIQEGARLLTAALARSAPSRFAVLAAIAAVHAEAPTWESTDWAQIAGLYDVLAQTWPSPVVSLNRAAAIGFRDGPEAGLEALRPLSEEPALATYVYLSATRADFLRQLGRWSDAAGAYEEAIHLCDNDIEGDFLNERLAQVRAREA